MGLTSSLGPPPATKSTITVSEMTGWFYEADRNAEHPEDPTVVLIHGIGSSGRYFAQLADYLVHHINVVAVTLPGFGGTPRPEVPSTIAAFADWVAGGMEQLGIHPSLILGHSMGSQIATELVVRHPELATSLVVIGPVCDDRKRSAMRQGWRLGVDAMRDRPIANGLVFTDFFRGGPLWYARTLPSMVGYPLENRIELIQDPVVIIRGDKDKVSNSAWCHRLLSRVGEGELWEYPKERHNLQVGEGDDMAQRIADFARRTARPGDS